MYRKYFTNYTSYKEISTKDDLYGTILSLLKDNEADPEAIEEKILNKRTDKNETTLPKEL